MKIFITGSSGFIGKCLYSRLENTHELFGFDIKKSNLQDIRDNKLVLKAMQHFAPDVVIHLAALTAVRESMQHPCKYYETNAIGTHNVIQSAITCNVKKVLVASSSSVYSDQVEPLDETMECNNQLSPYAVSKKSAEMICQYLGQWIPISVFRPFTVYGQNGREDQVFYRIITAAKNKTIFEKYGDGNSSRGYTHIDDLIDGIVKLIDYTPTKCDIFNLGGSEKVTLDMLIHYVKLELGEFPITVTKRHYADVCNSIGNIDKAKKILQWQPHRKFSNEIKKLCH